MPARCLRLFPLGLAALALAASPSAAPAADFGFRAGAYLEDADPFVGVEGLFELGASNWFFNPNLEAVFAEERDRISLNADFHYDFLTRREYSIWAGGGLALIHSEAGRNEDSDDEVGANFLAGIGWLLDDFTPYAQLKVVAADDAEVVAAAGIRF